jgi:hypothetical protein
MAGQLAQTGTPPTSSNLVRFQPKVASKASGTPLKRWQNQMAEAQSIQTQQRRLPLTQWNLSQQANGNPVPPS